LIPAIGVAALLLAVPFIGGAEPGNDVPAAVDSQPAAPDETGTVLESLVPVASAQTTLKPVRGLPRTPARTASATPTPTATPSASRSPRPVRLGPASAGQLEYMVKRYCVRYANSSDPDPRRDGRWECDRGWLSSPRLVNMDVACRDTYGDGAYATNPDGGAYDWRCYRVE